MEVFLSPRGALGSIPVARKQNKGNYDYSWGHLRKHPPNMSNMWQCWRTSLLCWPSPSKAQPRQLGPVGHLSQEAPNIVCPCWDCQTSLFGSPLQSIIYHINILIFWFSLTFLLTNCVAMHEPIVLKPGQPWDSCTLTVPPSDWKDVPPGLIASMETAGQERLIRIKKVKILSDIDGSDKW